MPWKKVEIGYTDFSLEKIEPLMDAYFWTFVAAGSPVDAVVLSGEANSKYVYYFSPQAVSIADSLIVRFGGIDCVEPSPEGLALVLSNSAR